jgi:hypothetical protein
MVRRFLILITLLFGVYFTRAQVFDFSDVIKLSPAVNTTAEESMPLLSPDQRKLFFVRSIYKGNTGGEYAGQDIWCSEKTETGWKTASNKFDFLNDKGNNALIGINKDGKTLYMLNSSPSVKLEGIYFSKVIGKTWSRPELIPIPGIDNQDFMGIYVSPDYDVIFLTMRGPDSRGEEDIYISIKNSSGEWSRPKNLGATINTNGFEISPFLSADKKRLYFSSNGHSGMGDADIFYSERLYNSWETWSAPVNLGPVVNSKKFDAYFSIYGDSVAYFTSNRDQQLSDIYRVKVSPKTSFLEAGEQYLTQQEWNAMVGKNANGKFSFSKNSTALTASQKELLYFIANKISGNSDIKIQLVAREEDDAESTRARLRAIYGELRQAGIDSDRIREEQRRENVRTVETGGVIELLLFKGNSG